MLVLVKELISGMRYGEIIVLLHDFEIHGQTLLEQQILQA